LPLTKSSPSSGSRIPSSWQRRPWNNPTSFSDPSQGFAGFPSKPSNRFAMMFDSTGSRTSIEESPP
jgi:hypothetical protein